MCKLDQTKYKRQKLNLKKYFIIPHRNKAITKEAQDQLTVMNVVTRFN
jgi:hypothetical protein